MLLNCFAFIFGAAIGSFLNVCIFRLPAETSIVKPRSQCPYCQHPIRNCDNIPLISFIVLRGKCRDCGGKISWRYPLVELITALLFLAFFARYGLSYNFFFYVVLASALIIATFVDIPHRIIPDEVSIGGLIVGFILNSIRGFNLTPLSFSFKPMLSSLAGMIVGAGIIYLTGWLFDLIYFRLLKNPPINGETESMGGGDVKLLAMIGAFLGWPRALLTFFIAPFFGAIIGMITLITKKDHTIPYGPFLSLAALISIFFSNKILHLLIP
jgi:leader peptidase (prepilin peptidase)/N-methyltransferase